MIDLAGATGRGVIVVARSSNPEGRRAAAGPDRRRGRALRSRTCCWRDIAELNRSGRVPSGTVGAVIGATLGALRLPPGRPGGVILAPGVGAQGGTAAEVGALFAECPAGSVLASSSRSLLATGPDVAALAEAAAQARDEMADALA